MRSAGSAPGPGGEPSPGRRRTVFRSRFFWRLYVSYAILVVLTATAIGLLIQRQLVAGLTGEIERRLFGQAVALAPLAVDGVAGGDLLALRSAVDAVGSETGSRITLIALDGLVLADTEEDPARMDNHADRPEFVAAVAQGRGTARRLSDTVQTFQLYVARTVIDPVGASIGVVRVSIPLAEVDAQVAAARWQIVRGAAIGIVVALGLGIVVARRLTAPITEITALSEALRRGDYQQRLEITGSDEVGILAATLNRLADELTDRLAKLVHRRAQLDAMLLGMEEGVLALDDEGTVAFTNRSALHLLGASATAAPEDLGTALTRIDGFSTLIGRVRETQVASRREITIELDEEEIVLDARATPFDAEGERGVLLVLYDITNLRRLERIRTDFVANVSHELKTPLTSIQGYVETLLDGAVHDPDHNIRFLEKIERHVRRLSALVTDLLSLARIETPAQMLQLDALDLRQVVKESVARRVDPIGVKHLVLTLDLGNEPALVTGEPEAARQIVDNLLDNAINYTPDNGEIRICTAITEGNVQLTITDTGIGIPADALDRIFERFYRVDRGRSREVGGTGLGLSIVRNLVQRMNGQIAVESAVGEGSRFTATFPAAGS